MPKENAPNHIAKPSENMGHGWVHPRADGKREKCGGPDGGCKVCKQELEIANAPYCPSTVLEGDSLFGCTKPGRLHGGKLVADHHGSHDYDRKIGSYSELLKVPQGLDGIELDRVKLTQAGVPWFTCGYCKMSVPHTKGIEKLHEQCEAKSLGIEAAGKFDEKDVGTGILVVKTGEGAYGLLRRIPGNPPIYDLLKKDEDWDATLIYLTQIVGNDLPLSTGSRGMKT